MNVFAKKDGKKGSFGQIKRQNLLFYSLGLALPLLQFIVFYIAVNLNVFRLAFSEYNYFGEFVGKYTFAGWKNFAWFIGEIKNEPYFLRSVLNGLMIYGIGLCTTLLTLLISFFIYKRMPCAKFFTVMLMIPQMISGVVTTMVFKYFMEDGVSAILEKITGEFHFGVFSGNNTTAMLLTMIFYGAWFGMGGGILTYASVMRGINQGVIEAAEIDGVTVMQEFFYIVIPMIWPTFATFFYLGVSGILTADCGQYVFFQGSAPQELYTFGYWIFLHTVSQKLSDYPKVAAVGLSLSAVVIPMTLIMRKILFKYGPSDE